MLVPVHLEQGMTARSFTVKNQRSGIPELYGLNLTTDEGQDLIEIVHDTPQRRRRWPTKSDQELADAKALVSQVLTPQTGRDFSISVANQALGPPDLRLTSTGLDLGLEMTQLHVPDPSGGKATPLSWWGRASRFLEELRDRGPRVKSQLRAHRGRHVCAFVNPKTGRRLPSLDDFIDLLASTNPPPDLPDGDELPDPAPEGCYRWSQDGSFGITWGVHLPKGFTSPTFEALGFELAIGHQFRITSTAVTTELNRLVRQHDHHRNDILCVSVNVPVREGWYFPSETILADLVLDADPALLENEPAATRTVIVHDVQRARWRLLHGQLPR